MTRFNIYIYMNFVKAWFSPLSILFKEFRMTLKNWWVSQNYIKLWLKWMCFVFQHNKKFRERESGTGMVASWCHQSTGTFYSTIQHMFISPHSWHDYFTSRYHVCIPVRKVGEGISYKAHASWISPSWKTPKNAKLYISLARSIYLGHLYLEGRHIKYFFSGSSSDF